MGMPLLILGTSTSKIIKKVGPYLDITNKFFGLLFCIVAIWLLERIISIQVAAYLWATNSKEDDTNTGDNGSSTRSSFSSDTESEA